MPREGHHWNLPIASWVHCNRPCTACCFLTHHRALPASDFPTKCYTHLYLPCTCYTPFVSPCLRLSSTAQRIWPLHVYWSQNMALIRVLVTEYGPYVYWSQNMALIRVLVTEYGPYTCTGHKIWPLYEYWSQNTALTRAPVNRSDRYVLFCFLLHRVCT
jgi:hypothetical protein